MDERHEQIRSHDVIGVVRDEEIVRALRAPDVKERLFAEGAEVVASTPEELGSYIKSETGKWAQVIKAAGIKPE